MLFPFIKTWQERIEEGDEIEMQIESEHEEEEEEEEDEGEEEDKRAEERQDEEDQEAKEAKDNTQVMKFRFYQALNVESSCMVSNEFQNNMIPASSVRVLTEWSISKRTCGLMPFYNVITFSLKTLTRFSHLQSELAQGVMLQNLYSWRFKHEFHQNTVLTDVSCVSSLP